MEPVSQAVGAAVICFIGSGSFSLPHHCRTAHMWMVFVVSLETIGVHNFCCCMNEANFIIHRSNLVFYVNREVIQNHRGYRYLPTYKITLLPVPQQTGV